MIPYGRANNDFTGLVVLPLPLKEDSNELLDSVFKFGTITF